LCDLGIGAQDHNSRRPSMVLFCDVCGTRFEQGDLRPQSKFCLVCGEQLSAWVKKKLDEASRVPPSPVLSEIEVQPLPRRNSKTLPATPSTETEMALDDEPSEQRRQTPVSMDCDVDEVDESSIASPLPAQTLTTAGVTHDYPELSLDINTYNFPPSFPVPPHYGQPFSRRSVIMKVLGGNNQTTYPHRANGRGIYVCLRIDMNPLSPRFAGAHGIIVTRPMPTTVVNPHNTPQVLTRSPAITLRFLCVENKRSHCGFTEDNTAFGLSHI
jgi:predicted  nucleic acid-binding Zn-ribbon protein